MQCRACAQIGGCDGRVTTAAALRRLLASRGGALGTPWQHCRCAAPEPLNRDFGADSCRCGCAPVAQECGQNSRQGSSTGRPRWAYAAPAPSLAGCCRSGMLCVQMQVWFSVSILGCREPGWEMVEYENPLPSTVRWGRPPSLSPSSPNIHARLSGRPQASVTAATVPLAQHSASSNPAASLDRGPLAARVWHFDAFFWRPAWERSTAAALVL